MTKNSMAPSRKLLYEIGFFPAVVAWARAFHLLGAKLRLLPIRYGPYSSSLFVSSVLPLRVRCLRLSSSSRLVEHSPSMNSCLSNLGLYKNRTHIGFVLPKSPASSSNRTCCRLQVIYRVTIYSTCNLPMLRQPSRRLMTGHVLEFLSISEVEGRFQCPISLATTHPITSLLWTAVFIEL
jgi:hypothetical protein